MKNNEIAEAGNFTVVGYDGRFKFSQLMDFQSEAQLEDALIRQLMEQGYERIRVNNASGLEANLRKQLEKLNNYTFSDGGWARFFDKIKSLHGVKAKTELIQEGSKFSVMLDHTDDDGTARNIKLIDKAHIHKNTVQVLNQYEATGASPSGEERKNRYDVTILVNGLPMVHIELKRRGVNIREAFNQINRYSRESFWADGGLFEFVQIFVISNGTQTKYYSNTTRENHIKEGTKRGGMVKNSFEFTSFWAYDSNRRIEDLREFTATFFAKNSLLNILTKYCVFTENGSLMVMRPYQIAATERILNRIRSSLNHRQTGTVDGGGYIWHTTGSGKTLTSFKTARLASAIDEVDKVIFVVDRQDLDYQTMLEYNKFEKGSVDGTNNTRELERKIDNPSKSDTKILVTTIQKLAKFVKSNDKKDIYGKNVVFIFDECHRSQFGEMHKSITKKFKKYMLFGFTGTPIFPENAGSSGDLLLKTTEQAFGVCLHTYTILDAIQDENVLKFKVDTINTVKSKNQIADEDKEISAIDAERALKDPRRISEVVKYILEHFDQKTLRNTAMVKLSDRRVNGFNSMFATSKIETLKLYYNEFKKQMSGLPENQKLKIATIFSYSQNDEAEGGLVNDEDLETDTLAKSDRDFLAGCIQDYNKMFGTTFDTSSNLFQDYYKDLSRRIKNRDLDLVIVVNMFLTGFDAPTLNTLWVDKNLKFHGLIQAFSRTNRILDSAKNCGQIVCFRNLDAEIQESVSLFGNSDGHHVIFIRPFNDYYNGYTDDDGGHHPGYKDIANEILNEFPLPIDRNKGEEYQHEFAKKFGQLLKLKGLLVSFDDFAKNEKFINDGQMQDYQSFYLDIRDKVIRERAMNAENINDDLVFEMELINSYEINIDYILMLIEKYRDEKQSNSDISAKIMPKVSASPHLRNKRDLIEDFIEQINAHTDITGEWRSYIDKHREAELEKIINDENLKEEETRALIKKSMNVGKFNDNGSDIGSLMKTGKFFAVKPEESRGFKRMKITEKLREYFNRFFGI